MNEQAVQLLEQQNRLDYECFQKLREIMDALPPLIPNFEPGWGEVRVLMQESKTLVKERLLVGENFMRSMCGQELLEVKK